MILSENCWRSADEPFFRLTGFAFRKEKGVFRRFEENIPLPPGVYSNAWHTPGGMLQFMTDSPFIRLKFSAWHVSHLSVNTLIAASGFDLYMGKPGKKQYFCGVTRMKAGETEYCVDLIENLTPGVMREFTLHFPLYGGVERLEIGLAENAVNLPPSPWADDRPVVFYGTSIIHGGCANRPGMALTNLLSRRFNRPFLNFGFSGTGKGEPEVFEQLARVENPALYILDYGPNVTSEGMKATLGKGIEILRKVHKSVPILVVGKFHFMQEYLETFSLTRRGEDVQKMIDFQKEEVRRRRRRGDKNIFFLPGDWGKLPDWTEFTIDGVHPTDLGFYMHARFMGKCFEKFLTTKECCK